MKKIILSVLILAFIAFLYFYYFGITKEQAIKIIEKGSQQTLIENWYANLSTGFIIAWAKGIRLLKATFEFDGVKYSTLNGSAI